MFADSEYPGRAADVCCWTLIFIVYDIIKKKYMHALI